jgi:hypothetical protein
MATADNPDSAGPDWAVSNPWPWMAFAVAAAAAAFGVARLRGDELPELLFPCLVAGVLAAAAALWLRFRRPYQAAADRLGPTGRRRALVGGEVACAAVVVAATFALVTGVGRLGGPWSPSASVLLWLAVAPWAAYLASRFWHALAGGEPLAERHDGAALTLLAGAVAFLACWSLYFGPEPEQVFEWDSMRLFFAALAGAALLASYIAGAAGRWRYRLVSAVIVVHFGGILNVCLAHEPGPWSVQQVWIRLYRPYLEFMHLNNPYRFYAPEPGPSSQLWFFVDYADPKTGKKVDGRWLNLPGLDENGRPQYALGLQYQRRLAMMENAARPGRTVRPLYVLGPNGRMDLADHYRKRDNNSPFPQGREALGRPEPGPVTAIPYHPTLPVEAQYAPPEPNARILLRSFAKHVLREPHPERPELVPVAVKIYRARHLQLRPEELAAGLDPHAPTLYLPYYVGQFGPTGELLDPDDPFLNWLVPIVPDPLDPQGRPRKYYIEHATGGAERG